MMRTTSKSLERIKMSCVLLVICKGLVVSKQYKTQNTHTLHHICSTILTIFGKSWLESHHNLLFHTSQQQRLYTAMYLQILPRHILLSCQIYLALKNCCHQIGIIFMLELDHFGTIHFGTGLKMAFLNKHLDKVNPVCG